MAMKSLKIQKGQNNTHSQFFSEDKGLNKYLQAIGKEKMITVEEEKELSKRIKLGDQEALEKLTKANLRFVVSVAKTYQNQGLSLSDLINEGNLGLIKAAQRFDEARGFKFISYAVSWIRQSILQAIAEQSKLVRLPVNQIWSSNKINKMISLLEQELQRSPTTEELAEVLDIKTKDIQVLLENGQKPLSFDISIDNNDEHWSSYIDNFSVEQHPTDHMITHIQSLQQDIQNILSTLDWKEKEIVELFFGLNNKPELTLEQIGERYNLTKERVRQIKERAIKKLKQPVRSKHLRWYL